MTGEGFKTFGEILKQIDGFVWGVPLIVLIIEFLREGRTIRNENELPC